jgi:predicted component of type VI protein secretion system
MSSREPDITRLLELRVKLKEAYNYLDEAKALIAAIMIIDDYNSLGEVEVKVEKALEQLREARRLLAGGEQL